MSTRRKCQYCGEPESILRRRVGFVVCFDCAEEGGVHDQAVADNRDEEDTDGRTGAGDTEDGG